MWIIDVELGPKGKWQQQKSMHLEKMQKIESKNLKDYKYLEDHAGYAGKIRKPNPTTHATTSAV